MMVGLSTVLVATAVDGVDLCSVAFVLAAPGGGLGCDVGLGAAADACDRAITAALAAKTAPSSDPSVAAEFVLPLRFDVNFGSCSNSALRSWRW